MKKLIIICCIAVNYHSFAQGLVKFSNSSSTLISYLPPAPPGSVFYFALLTAPLGTTDPFAFTFAGIYATNSTIGGGGRLQGGSATGVAVAGWAAGTSRTFEVAGWSANAGYVWNPAWMSFPPSDAYWGVSGIGEGFAGGTDSNGASIPPMAIFGAAPSLTTALTLIYSPEPGSQSFAGLAISTILISRRWARRKGMACRNNRNLEC